MSDVFTWGVSYIVVILLALYLAQRLEADVTQVVSIGTGIAFFARALVQIPLGMLGDRIKSSQDEAVMLMLGNLLMGLPIIIFTQITSVWQFYVLQVIYGAGCGLNLVDWRKLFAKNLTDGQEGLEYAVYDTLISFSIGILTILGGTIASISESYFNYVIGGVGVAVISSNFWVAMIYLKQKKKLQGTQRPG
jgi:MFS family permease